jgi:hypothetical protein
VELLVMLLALEGGEGEARWEPVFRFLGFLRPFCWGVTIGSIKYSPSPKILSGWAF